MDDSRERITVDAPELGASVVLVECTVGELLPLIALATEGGHHMDLIMATLAATLEIDGRKVTQVEMRAWPARTLRALMRIGPQALAINNFARAETDDGEEAPPKHYDPLRRLLFVIAQRVGTPVYVLEREMPGHEFMEWILFFRAEQDAHGPPDVEDMGAEGLAMSLGAEVPSNGS